MTTDNNAQALKPPKDPFRDERVRAFVIFQAVFWGANLVIRSLAALELKPEYLLAYLGPRTLIVLAGATATTAMALILRRVEHWPTPQRLWIALGLCVLALAPMHLLEKQLTHLAAPQTDTAQFIDYVTRFGWVFFMWAGYYFVMDHGFRIKRQAAAIAAAERAAHEAQLKMLRYQLNPHFLFNTLNSISALVLDRQFAEAERMINRLSQFLRHTIDTDPAQLITLAAETRFQQLYLDIEKARFGDRLQLSMDMDPELQNCLVPSLVTQPIVENAIKYAVAPNPEGGRIAIGSFRRDGQLVLYVADDGPGLPAPGVAGGRGLGLRNTSERLERAFAGRARLTLDANPTGRGVRVELAMPRVTGEPAG
jgi:signal transduction histidine kinase